MSDTNVKNALFDAPQLYLMLRLTYLDSFPYPNTAPDVTDVLTLYMRRHHRVDFGIQKGESADGIRFNGELYERYRDIAQEKSESFHGVEHSPVWYAVHLMQLTEDDLAGLASDLTQMRLWLEDNGYLFNDRATDKLLSTPALTFIREPAW